MSCPHCGAEIDDSARQCLACGASLGALGPGQLVAARWEVLGRLGSGGMGVVYKVHDRELDEVVALKVLRGDLARSEEMARRFRSEIKLARRVRHPNVCGIHEYGQDGVLRFIVMEFVEGVDLKRVLSGGAMPHEEALDVGAQIAAALNAIHQAGIVHRDLKPANVMLDAQGRVRLMDFGIAKQFGQDPAGGLTATGHIVGTPEYMSPEQVRGEALDLRSDIYSLGVMLFEVFAGRVPFRGKTAMATLYQHVHEPVPVEAAQAANVPPAVTAVLLRALAKSPDDRFGTAAELETALGEARGGVAPARVPHTTTLVRSALALKPQPVPEATRVPALAPTPVPAAVPTAVPVPVPTVERRAYAGPSPHARATATRAEAEPSRSRGVPGLLGAAFALAGVGALGWFYSPQLRDMFGLPGASPVELPLAQSSTVAAEPLAVAPATAGPATPARPTPVTPAQSAPAPTSLQPTPVPQALPSAAAVPPPTAMAAAVPAPSEAPPLVPPAASAATDAPPPSSAAPATEANLDHAEELFAQNRFGAALAEAKAVLLRQPGNRQAQQLAEDAEVELMVEKRLKEARDLMAAGEPDQAIEKLKLGLAAKPSDSRLLALWRELTKD